MKRKLRFDTNDADGIKSRKLDTSTKHAYNSVETLINAAIYVAANEGDVKSLKMVLNNEDIASEAKQILQFNLIKSEHIGSVKYIMKHSPPAFVDYATHSNLDQFLQTIHQLDDKVTPKKSLKVALHFPDEESEEIDIIGYTEECVHPDTYIL